MDHDMEKNIVSEAEEDQRAWDDRMQFGMVDDADPGAFEPLLLPQVAEALRNGEPVTVMGIAKEGVACGALAGYIAGDCFHVASLYVAPDYRRQGGARRMIRELEALIGKLSLRRRSRIMRQCCRFWRQWDFYRRATVGGISIPLHWATWNR